MSAELPVGEELATVFARMSGALLSAETVETALQLVTSLATETVSGSAGAGVTVIDSRGRRSTAASDPLVEAADGLQYQLDEGPCLEAATTRLTVRMDDLRAESRWPRWSAAASGMGLSSVLSAPLIAGESSLGAIKVYGRQPHAFDERAEHRLGLFAEQAAILLAHLQSYDAAQRLSEALQQSLRNRDVITLAKGVLMARDRIDESAAFAMLVSRSQAEHRALHEVARALVAVAVRHTGSEAG